MFKEVSANCFHKFLLIIFVFIFLCKSVAAQSEGYSAPINSAVGLGSFIATIVCVIKVCICCVKRCRCENRELDSSPSTRNQRRTRGAERGSQASEEEQEDNRYPEMSVICLELKDAERGQNYTVCSHAESGLENESEHLDCVEIIEQEVCEVPLRVLYENLEKGEETNKFDPSSTAKEATDSGTYLEIVVEDGDDGVGKGSEPLYAEQEDFRKNLKPIDAPKESNLDYENPGIYEQESKTVYEKLDQFGNNLNPVDDQLNLSSMTDHPVDIKK